MDNNMEDTERRLAEDTDKVRMLRSEKEAVRRRVIGTPFTEEPASGHEPPYTLAAYMTRIRQSRSLRVSLATLAVLLVAGAPLTYAAQQSGPGDALHGLETGVVEKVESALHFSAKNRAAYHIERLEERFAEISIAESAANMPDAASLLSDEEYERAAGNIGKHAVAILSALPRIEDPRAAMDVLVQASAVLDAQEEFLEEAAPGAAAEDIVDEANDDVSAELSGRVEAYVSENNPFMLIDVVREEIAKVQAMADSGSADVFAPEVRNRLEDALEGVRAGDLDQALHSVLEAQVAVLAQGYSAAQEEAQEEEVEEEGSLPDGDGVEQ